MRNHAVLAESADGAGTGREVAGFLGCLSSVLARVEQRRCAWIAVMSTACKALALDVGQVWLPHPDGIHLALGDAWCRPGVEGFREASSSLAFSRGEGMIGRAWSLQDIVFVPDVTAAGDFLRGPAALRCGLRSALACAVRVDGEVALVLEFSMREHRLEVPLLLAVVSAVAAQLGGWLTRWARLDGQMREVARLEGRMASVAAGLEAANQEMAAVFDEDLQETVRRFRLLARAVSSGAAVGPVHAGLLTASTELADALALRIEALMELSRIGRLPRRRERVSLHRLAASIIDEMALETFGRSIAWNLRPLPTVDADAVLMRRVLCHLLSNAARFAKPGGDAVVEVGSAASEEGDAIVYVRDNGIGFPPDDAALLFQPFPRGHLGRGTGLATVRRIVHLHSGRVWAEGRPGGGAAFYFSLPST